MQQVQHEAERKAPFHQPLTLKHRDESRCPSRRSSVSSSTGSIFSDLASVASFGSTATSFSVHSTGQSDWSGLDSDFDDDLGVHASLLGGAQSSHASSAHHHYGVPFPTLDLLKSRSTEASPGEFTSGTTAPQLGATSHDGFKVPPIDLPLLRRPLRRETLPSQTTLPLRSVGNTFGPLPSLSASHNAPAVARASSLQGRPVSQTDTSGIAHFTGNPRRTAADPQRTKPTLVRQENRRVDYVEQLVDITEQLIAFIWPTSRQPADAVTRTGKSTICLRYFIREVLRRSKTSHSTLQVALYYCFMIWKSGRLPALDGRRMFLSSLMLSFKYLQDRNFSTRAWSSISSLPPAEIKMIEMTFLKAIDYSLFIRNSDWQEWRMRVCYGMWHARQSAPCPWKSLLSGMLHYQKFGTPSMASPSALTATPSVTFDSPALIPTAGNNRGRRPGPRTGSGIITPPSSPSPEPLSLDTRMQGVVPTIARQEPPTATVQTARPATAIKVEPVDAQTITPTSSHCSWTGAEVPSVLKAPKMSPLTSPDSVLEEPSFHPSTALGRMVHATPSGSANLQMPNTGTETPRTSSCQPKPTDGKVDIFSPSTAYSDHENAPSMKEAAQVPTLREEYCWLEHNYCLVEDHEDLVSRRLEGRSAKSRSGTNVRRKRSIRTAAAGCEENSARAKMARHRRA